MKVLKIKNLTKRFGGLVAVDKVNMYVNEGELLGLIGPNGSGKTTLFNCVTGFYQPDKGKIEFKGQDITHEKMDRITERGLYRTFQLPRPFPELSVFQNVLLSQPHENESLVDIMFKRSSTELEREARDAIEFVGLTALRDELAGNLSGGQQKLLEFAAALMKNPEVILLDEPLGGVNPTLINDILQLIQEINDVGKTFFIIEHNMEAIMGIAERLYVLHQGRVLAEGDPKDIQNSEEVLEAYFGE